MGNRSTKFKYPPIIAHFDPVRYQGLWWGIARFDTLPFLKGCDRGTAQYTWDSGQKIMNITNSCYKNSQIVKTATGKAYVPNWLHPGRLIVTFDQQPGRSEPYWIQYTDYDNYAIVSGPPGCNVLWILSRRQTIRPEDQKFLIGLVDFMKHNTAMLIGDPTAISPNAPLPIEAKPEPWILQE